MADQFSRSVTDVGDIHLVALRGELDLATADGLSGWLIEISGSTVVIDLSELAFMDSSGIAALIQTKNELGDCLVLTRPRANVRRVFDITGLGAWFTDWNPAWSPETPTTTD
jgi:anti-sigma B factor antagonist